MSFDEDNNDIPNSGDRGSNEAKTFFGMELGNGATYAIVIILTLIFIRQVVTVLEALG